MVMDGITAFPPQWSSAADRHAPSVSTLGRRQRTLQSLRERPYKGLRADDGTRPRRPPQRSYYRLIQWVDE